MRIIKYIVFALLILLVGCADINDGEEDDHMMSQDDNFTMEEFKFSVEEIYINGNTRILDLVDANPAEVLTLLGGDFELWEEKHGEYIVATYYSNKTGIIVTLEPIHASLDALMEGRVQKIRCFDSADINGAKEGMYLAEIRELLGEGEILNFMGNATQPFGLRYAYQEFRIMFGLTDENGYAEDVTIAWGYW